MTVELRPGGVSCNLGCTYCYQEPMRLANGNKMMKYDIDEMIRQVEMTGQNFSLFGGEALLIPRKDLEKLWKYGYEKFGRNSIQTNGTLITDEHIELFKKYKVSVGVSIDGPEELNDLREDRSKPGDKEATRIKTRKTIENIRKLKEDNIGVGIIITLHRLNGTGENLEKLIDFILELSEIRVISGNIHTLEVNETMPDQEKYVLTQEENAKTFIRLAEFFKENPRLKWQPFAELKNIIYGDDSGANCIWKNCDPMNTKAVYGIEGDGALSNCGRTNKEGVDWYKADDNGYSRYISLYNTPPEMGGCQGCRFWMACGGSCPGESQSGDFRNKTIHCHTQYELLSWYEREAVKSGIEPITLSNLRPSLEALVLDFMKHGKQLTIKQAIEKLKLITSKPIVVPVKGEKE